MHIVPGSATRDDYTALRDVLEVAQYPLTAPALDPAAVARVEQLASDIDRALRAEVFARHMTPTDRAAWFVPGELSPDDGA